jgi:3-methyladenine DNA glycosylase/8-oxoguanine DNA glycosylase
MVFALYNDIRQAGVQLEEVAEVGGQDEAAKKRARTGAMRKFSRVTELQDELAALQQKLEATPKRQGHVQARLKSKLSRLTVGFRKRFARFRSARSSGKLARPRSKASWRRSAGA